jgi:hypothetical protein
MSFITAELATTEAIRRGLLTEETASTAAIEFLILMLESQVVSWLGWNPNPTEYTETLLTTNTGACLTTQYPIVELVSMVPKNPQFGLIAIPMIYAWNGSVRTISTGLPSEYVEIVYRAGLNPVPPIFGLLIMQLCMTAIENGSLESGDLSFLNEAPNTVKALSLPGGLSTTYQDVAKMENPTNSPIGLRMIDKLLAPIADYQRRINT